MMLRTGAAAVAAILTLAPFGAQCADLVIWWQEGAFAEENAAVEEIIAAFEQGRGKQIDVLFFEQEELLGTTVAAIEDGSPPDFAFGIGILDTIPKWALEDRLVDLSEIVGSFSNLFDPEALDWATLLNASTEQRALYALPIGRTTVHIHVWQSLMENAGFTLEDIPREWDAFWSFWCDEVQPAVRRATGREDIWGVGLSMGPEDPDTDSLFLQFAAAYDSDYLTRDGRLVIDDPVIRKQLIRTMDSYTAIYRKDCTPPDSITWGPYDNNQQFLDQSVVMTPNQTLSVPNALKTERPDDYYKNTATIEWPLSPHGEPFPINGNVFLAVVFKAGGHTDTAKDFVHFLIHEGWLAQYHNFAAERMLPPMQKLRDQPFWLDPTDRHRMAAVMQVASRPLHHDYVVASGGDWRHGQVYNENIWANAVNRVVTDGITPEQAVDEAIARIKEILSQ